MWGEESEEGKGKTEKVKRDEIVGQKEEEKIFSHQLDVSDYIILSPGININKAHLKKKLIENKTY